MLIEIVPPAIPRPRPLPPPITIRAKHESGVTVECSPTVAHDGNVYIGVMSVEHKTPEGRSWHFCCSDTSIPVPVLTQEIGLWLCSFVDHAKTFVLKHHGQV